MTPEEIAKLAQEMGGELVSDPDEIAKLAASMGGTAETTEQPQGFDLGQQIAGDLGAVARGVVKGVTGLVTVPADFLVALANTARNMATGQGFQGPAALLPSGAIDGILNMSGLPPEEQQSELQKIMQATTEGMTNAKGWIETGKTLADVGTGAVKGLGQALAAQPTAQILGSGAAGAASQTAENMGADPLVQAGAGLLGGVAGSMAAPSGVQTSFRSVATGAAKADEVGKIVKVASSGNSQSAKVAQKKLAEMAAIDPEAKAAAEKLGIVLPPDVFSDNPMIREAAGLTRSVAGSAASGDWRTTVRDAVDKADEVMEAFDAPFIEGKPSTAVVSSQVKNQLLDSRKKLYDEAAKLSNEVDILVPKSTPASTTNLKAYLDGQIADVGGKDNLTSYEKKLYALVNSPNTTYGLLNRERSIVGDNLGKMKDAQFGDTDSKAMNEIYAAMAQDRLETVDKISGPETKEKLLSSNVAFGKAFDIQDRIVDAFGKSGDGDIATDLPAAILSVGKGKGQDLNRILDIVPEDLQKQAVATALASATRAKGGSEKGGFGFSEYATLYPQLRANPEGYAKIVKALGPGSDETLQALYKVSKRLTEARANVLTTGKANQGLVESMTGENLVNKVMNGVISVGTKRVPIAGSEIEQALTSSAPKKLEKAAKLFNSEKFQAVLSGKASPASILDSPEFKVYADTVKIPLKDRQQWLLSATATGSTNPAKPPLSSLNPTGQPLPKGFK